MNLYDVLDDYLSEVDPPTMSKALSILQSHENELEVSEGKKGYKIIVPSQSRSEPYQVHIRSTDSGLEVTCNCPAYKEYGTCKHGVAAALYLEEINEDDEEDFEDYEEWEGDFSDAQDTVSFRMPEFNLIQLKKMAGAPPENAIINWERKTKLVEQSNNRLYFHVIKNRNVFYEVNIRFDGKDCYETNCDCYETGNTICIHTLACFYHIRLKEGPNFFKQFKDLTIEKNKLLQPYGLTVDDPEAALFTWELNYFGQLKLTGKPDYIVPAGNTSFLHDLKNKILDHGQRPSLLRPKLPDDVLTDYEIGILFNFTVQRHIGFELDALQILEKNGKQKIKKLSINNQANYALLQPLSDELFQPLIEFSDQRLVEWFAQSGNSYLRNYANPWHYTSEGDAKKIHEHFMELLRSMWPMLCEYPYVFMLKEGRFSQANIKPVKVSRHNLATGFRFTQGEKFITVELMAIIHGKHYKGKTIPLLRNLVFLVDDTLHLPANDNIVGILEKFRHGKLQFPLAEKKNVLLNLIIPLREKYEVETDENLNYELQQPAPQPRVLLSELNEQSLLLRPQFLYGDDLVDYGAETDIFSETEDGKLVITSRNKAEEKKLYDFLRTLHPRFATQNNNQHYYLPFNEVLKNNWFFNMIKQVEATGFPVFGLKELKKFRYNTSTPKIKIEAGSGIDWFDLKITAQWGDQQVTLKDLRKAIINRQEAVLLDDGTLGLIPEEWLKQYRTLLKIGNEQNGSLKISKLHFSILDQLDASIDNQKVREEIEQKKVRLREFDKVNTVSPSGEIKATLRPYQLAGFQWLNTIDELGWGGCLADDMGLGKTLQAIAFLQMIKEKNPGCTSLVVCPTSLLFNWENELQKFCPSLKYYVYYGLQRNFSDEHFEEYDLVLTSYGIIRNDLEALMKFQWHYAVLDESQAIKNPEAQVTRAVSHLKAKNKLILSGTPVQNNTQDLFAQFNFLNPGLLGSRDFFKEEFANAIDRNQDKDKAGELRRLVYPFMLRRTKEQVARDLPDKTETIIWCIMGKTQRSIYTEYKNYYRDLLLKKIDEDGIGKSGMYVLEGLLRLRQICDHTALLKDEQNATDESVKIEELLREISENTGEHKLLIFSQFTEMLALVRDELKKNKTSYCYLDGSTPASKRKEEVNRFQEDDSIKVFLISLKAGGVGLNLTAADYVYIIDPWWNPAAEQQAIDRTHRIGQTRKIFAYKMICKDTVEEKILQLQQRKKNLADELVSEDAGFVKKLTRDDVAFLFS